MRRVCDCKMLGKKHCFSIFFLVVAINQIFPRFESAKIRQIFEMWYLFSRKNVIFAKIKSKYVDNSSERYKTIRYAISS